MFTFCKNVIGMVALQFILMYGINFAMDAFFSDRPEALNVPLQYEESDNKKYDAIVKIGNADGKPFCSGYVASKDYVVTAAHCLTMPFLKGLKFTVTILDADNNILAVARPAAYSSRLDYGVIRGDFKDFKQYESEFHKNGFDKSYGYKACGFPMGQKVLNCVTFTPKGQSMFYKTGYAMFIPAMSGGPVIDLQTNKVVAVNSAVAERHALVTPVTGLLGAFGIEP